MLINAIQERTDESSEDHALLTTVRSHFIVLLDVSHGCLTTTSTAPDAPGTMHMYPKTLAHVAARALHGHGANVQFALASLGGLPTAGAAARTDGLLKAHQLGGAACTVWDGMVRVWMKEGGMVMLAFRTRRLLRKGRVQLVVLNDKGKYVKSKTLELFLFNDMMQYCKPVRHKKTDTLHYVVYKQVSQCSTRALPHYPTTPLPCASSFAHSLGVLACRSIDR
jgi:hypothetical protein